MPERKKFEFLLWNDGIPATLTFSSNRTIQCKKGDVVEITEAEAMCYPDWFRKIPEPVSAPKPIVKKEEPKPEAPKSTTVSDAPPTEPKKEEPPKTEPKKEEKEPVKVEPPKKEEKKVLKPEPKKEEKKKEEPKAESKEIF